MQDPLLMMRLYGDACADKLRVTGAKFYETPHSNEPLMLPMEHGKTCSRRVCNASKIFLSMFSCRILDLLCISFFLILFYIFIFFFCPFKRSSSNKIITQSARDSPPFPSSLACGARSGVMCTSSNPLRSRQTEPTSL